MTAALCTNCGNLKVGAYLICDKCNCGPTGNESIDIAFTDHYLTEQTLREFGQIIQVLHLNTNDESTAFWAFMKYVSDYYPEILYYSTIPRKYRNASNKLLEQTNLPNVFVEDSPRLDTVESLDPDNQYQSHVRHHKIECESCGHIQSFAIWSRIDGSYKPWMKTLIETGRIFGNHCRCCGCLQQVAYETLYLDIEKLLAIWLRNSNCTHNFKINLPNQKYFDNIASDFTFRVVSSPSELDEKIVIFADGHDDLLIEFIKLCVSIQNGIDITDPLEYFGTSRKIFFGGTMQFLALDSLQVFKYPYWLHKANASKVMKKLRPIMTKFKKSWISVDREFILRIAKESGLMKPL